MSLLSSQTLTKASLSFLILFAFTSAFSIALSQISFGFALILLIGVLITGGLSLRKLLTDRLYLLILLFVLWQLICGLLGQTPGTSALMLREEWLFLIIPAGVLLLRDPDNRKRIILALAGGVILTAVYGIIQRFTGVDWILGHPIHTVGGGHFRPSGFFSYPLTYGNYMATAATFLFAYSLSSLGSQSGWKKWLLIGAGILGVVAVFLSNSRGPMLAAAVGLLVYGFLFWKARYVAGMLALIAVAAIALAPGLVDRLAGRFETDFDVNNQIGRLHIWRNGLAIAGDNLLTGVGAGNFHDEYYTRVDYPEPERGAITHAHSDLLNILALYGIPGFLLYLGLWLSVVSRFARGAFSQDESSVNRAIGRAALIATVAFFVSSLTEASFADEEVRQLLMLLWAVALAAGIGLRPNNYAESAAE